MASSERSRSGDVGGDISIILVTAAQLIFFTRYHKYIAWPTSNPDGGLTWLSLLTDDYFNWLPLVTTGSTIVIVASIIMILYHGYWFRQIAWIGFSIIGITMTTSLLTIFPFDFSVIPNPSTADTVQKLVTAVLVLMAVFYAISVVFLSVKAIRDAPR